MQTQEENTEVRERIAELKQKYLRLALECRDAGIRVNSQTIQEYLKELQQLEAQIN